MSNTVNHPGFLNLKTRPPPQTFYKPHVEFEQENQNKSFHFEQTSIKRPPLISLSLNVPNETVEIGKPKPENRRESRVKTTENNKRQGTSLHISRRNERERNRVKLINMGFERLRSVVPCNSGEQLSKISTLRKAIWYIEHLDRVLHGQDQTNCAKRSRPLPTDASSLSLQTHHHSRMVDRSAGQEVQQSTSRISNSSRGNINSSKVRAVEAVRMASWSSTDSPPLALNPRVTTSGGRPVNNKNDVASPIFPTQWGRSNAVELTSTPKQTLTTGPIKHGTLVEPLSGDSGYSSLNLSTSQPSILTRDWPTLGQVRTTNSNDTQQIAWSGYLHPDATSSVAFGSFPFYPWFGKT